MCTYLKSTVNAILDNFKTLAEISAKWIKISTTGNKFDQLPSLLRWAKKNSVNFGQLAAKFFWPILTHLKSTVCADDYGF